MAIFPDSEVVMKQCAIAPTGERLNGRSLGRFCWGRCVIDDLAQNAQIHRCSTVIRLEISLHTVILRLSGSVNLENLAVNGDLLGQS
ncbi:MAG: hypothetical protein SNJ57_08610 [Cyanobacteriota bacterium]